MARKRDYKKEYARRVLRARQQGYSSYYHKRKVSTEAKSFDGPQRKSFISFARQHPKVDTRRTYYRGMRAIMQKDHKEANRLARQLGYRTNSAGDPPERIFWYHEEG